MIPEELAVHPGLGVEALGIGERRELDEVSVARGVAGEEDEVIVGLPAVTRSPSLAPVARRDVCLHPDDGLYARFARLLLELPRRVEVAVVGDRERRLFELLSPVNQVGDPVGAI